MSTKSVSIPIPKATPDDLDMSTIASYEDGVDDSDGPWWFDALGPTSVQWEAEGTTPIDEQHRPHHHHECASPVERVKMEEEAFMAEAVAALWDSEEHSPEVRCKRRHSLLSQSEISAEGQGAQKQKGNVVAALSKMGKACQATGQQCCGRRTSTGHVDGVAVQVSRGAW